jgi:hypothetical protein
MSDWAEKTPDQISPARSCALCGTATKLELSHIIPQFVYRWQRVVLGGENRKRVAGQRIQDEPTRRMLCGHCEDLFSAYESEFARFVFHPFTTNGLLMAKYGAWLRKFAVSVCWRISEENLTKNPLGHFNGRWASELASCRETWKRYLSGKRPDIGVHHVHLLLLHDVVIAEGVRISADLAQVSDLGRTGPLGTSDSALQRSIEMDVSSSDNEAFVYAKLGPIILFGLIAEANPEQWRGTRINAEGKLKPREILIPARYRDYILSRVRSRAVNKFEEMG